jgi:hypothetical protein
LPPKITKLILIFIFRGYLKQLAEGITTLMNRLSLNPLKVDHLEIQFLCNTQKPFYFDRLYCHKYGLFGNETLQKHDLFSCSVAIGTFLNNLHGIFESFNELTIKGFAPITDTKQVRGVSKSTVFVGLAKDTKKVYIYQMDPVKVRLVSKSTEPPEFITDDKSSPVYCKCSTMKYTFDHDTEKWLIDTTSDHNEEKWLEGTTFDHNKKKSLLDTTFDDNEKKSLVDTTFDNKEKKSLVGTTNSYCGCCP